MTKFDDLNDAFNVESEVVPEKTKEIQKVEEAASSVQDVKKDYEYTRGNLYSIIEKGQEACLLYTSPSPRDGLLSRMPSSA